jgi:hypothetical protein
MIVIDRANLSTDRLNRLDRELSVYRQLYQVLNWYQQFNRLAVIPEVINQDEYSLDVIFDHKDDLFLVFGTT